MPFQVSNEKQQVVKYQYVDSEARNHAQAEATHSRHEP
jgi:hypothetical protein